MSLLSRRRLSTSSEIGIIMGILGLLLLPVAFFASWYGLAKITREYYPQIKGKRVGLLIAHCDDEAMFFSPTILALTDPKANNYVRILCLSPGAERHLCETRKSELLKSASILGVRSTSDITILEDHERFPDSMTTPWDANDVAMELSRSFSPSVDLDGKGSAPATPSTVSDSTLGIDILITFDHEGISSHANHKSLYFGALNWQSQLDKAGYSLALYSLTTTNVLRKYISLFDLPLTLLLEAISSSKSPTNGEYPPRLVFFSDITKYRTAQRAMTNGHKSQMLWFRYGWLALSRYVSTNDLVRRYPSDLHGNGPT